MGWANTVIIASQVIIEGADDYLLVYNGAPALGNLIASIAPMAGTDPYGNPYMAGIFLYETGGNAKTGLMWNTVAGSEPLLALFPDSDFGFTDHSPFILAGDTNKGLTSEYQSLAMGPGAPPPASSSPVMLAMYSASPDGTTSIPHMSVYVGASYDLIADFNSHGLIAANPVTANALETWHTITLDTGWSTVAGFDAPRYRLLPDGNLQLAGAAALAASRTTAANLNSSTPLPSAYWPVNTHRYRSYDSTPSTRFAVQISNAGVIEGLANAGGNQTIEIDGIIPLN